MTNYIQSNQTVQLTNADSTISEVDSGKYFLVPTLTADRTFTLPAVKAGLHYRFVNNCGAATLGAAGIIAAAAGNIVFGALLNVTPAVVAKTGQASCRFLTASKKGDYIDCVCDGTNWNVSGMSGVVGLGA